MAIGANFDLQIVAQSRTRKERVAAATSYGNFFVLGMDVSLHCYRRDGRVPRKLGAQCSRESATPQQIHAPAGGPANLWPDARAHQTWIHNEPEIGYPQKLWITLWTNNRDQERHRIITAGLSNCSIFRHQVL
jgi:hypothetical protein